MKNFKYYLMKIIKKCKMSAIKDSCIDKSAYISSGNTIINSTIGKYSYTSYNTQIMFSAIGNYCSIGSDCKIGCSEHPVEWVSTSPLFHDGRNVFNRHHYKHQYNPHSRVYIGNDVWIGQNVLIKGGITIGNGAVIGMGAVVTKDVGAYEIWAGNPARFIKKRFEDEQIKWLEKVEWWLWDDEQIQEMSVAFNSIQNFSNIMKSPNVQ